MEVTEEDENLFRARKVIEDELLPRLRGYFTRMWNGQRKQGTAAWNDSPDDGKALYLKLKPQWKKKLDKNVEEKLKSGKTIEWDATCLFTAILALNLGKEEHIFHTLKKTRNELFHKSHGGLSSSEKDSVFNTITDAYRKLSWPVHGVDKIEKAPITNKEMKQLKAQLEKEKKEAIKENQENLCGLPKRLKPIVGRANEMKELKEKLSKGDMFLIITGGPGYGKSRLAHEIGFALSNRQENESKFNYVIWINMRDVSNPPQLEDVAGIILREFRIDTTEMKERNIDILSRKFESITASGKRALLIFDNADDLISPQNSESCPSSTYMELSRHIGTHSRESSIRAILTTRVYNILDCNVDDHLLILRHLSDEESTCYLQQELKEMADLDREQIIKDIVITSCGHPFVLKLICSNVNNMQCGEMIEDFVNKFSKRPLDTAGRKDSKIGNINLFACFEFSFDRLQEDDKEFLSLIAVFPSRFSYKYVKKLLSFVGKSETLDPEELLRKLEKHSLIEDQSSNGTGYIIHLFLCQFIRKKLWKGSTSNEASYTKLYINELSLLGRKSLEKDSYFNCWKEFEMEQHNFLYVMTQIGEVCDQSDCPSHVEEAVHEVLRRGTPDFIAMCLFCIDLTKPSLLLRFVEACEKCAVDKQKKNIWCCRYDLSMKYFDSGIEDPYKEVEPDEYGKAVLDKRRITKKIHPFFLNKEINSFQMMKDELAEFSKRIDSLECVPVKNYFKHKILKLNGSLLKKSLNVEWRDATKLNCFKMFRDALGICNEHFGKSWLTIDCYNQLGKMSWRVGDSNEALQAFDKAIELAESMSLRNSKKFGACLLDKGRFLIDAGSEDQKVEGIALLEDVIHRCNEYSDTNFWCRAMMSLLTVDKTKVSLVKEQFFQSEKLNRLIFDMMKQVLKLDADSSEEDLQEDRFLEHEHAKATDLKKAIAKLETVLNAEISACVHDESTSLFNDAKKHLFVWQMWAALRYNHVLLLSERKEFAKNALELMSECPSIHNEKEEELQALVGQDFDYMEAEEMLRRGYYLERIGKKLVKEGRKDELMERYSTLLMRCEGNQRLWSFVVSQTSTNVPSMLEKETKLLSDQSEPCHDLLELVHSKFQYEIKIYSREASENIILEKSRKAVEDLKKAIQHIDKLRKQNDADAQVVVRGLGAYLICWYKCIALDADHCLLNDERRTYAEAALHAHGLGKDEREKLRKITTRESTKEEQEKRMKKSLICKVTKFMRKNGMQDDLEKKYEEFITDCSAFPRVRFEMVRFILMNKNVEIPKFAKYLRYLLRHFQNGSLNSWDYQFIIDLANKFLSNEMENSSQMENVKIYRLIFDSLHHSQIDTGLKNKLEFEFLAIFALKVGKDSQDVRVRKQDAQQALEIFYNIGGKYKRKDKRLFQLKLELEKLFQSRESEI